MNQYIIWDGENIRDVMSFMGQKWIGIIETVNNKFILINSVNGNSQAAICDCIAKDSQGEFYAFKPYLHPKPKDEGQVWEVTIPFNP